jgi:integrase/recombinase XerC
MHTVATETAGRPADLIDEYVQHLRDLCRAESTIGTYTDILRRMDRHLPLGLVSANHDELKAWIYSSSHGKAHRKLCRTIADGFFTWACNPADPQLDYNPATMLPLVAVPKGRPNPVAVDQKLDLLARAARPYRDWFLIAAFTGARCTELAALDREHITERRVLLHGKGDKQRLVPTHPVVWALAQQLPPGPIAVETRGRHRGERLTRQQVSHRGNYQLQRVLGLDGVHMHRLRSTYGTEAYATTRDLLAVQKLLGHASPTTTQTYVEVDDDALDAAVAGLRAA